MNDICIIYVIYVLYMCWIYFRGAISSLRLIFLFLKHPPIQPSQQLGLQSPPKTPTYQAYVYSENFNVKI